MKICLYLEFYHSGGILSSYKNQKVILKRLGIPFTTRYNESCDILQLNSPWPRSLFLMKKAKRQGKKVVIWSHTTVEDTAQMFKAIPFVIPFFRKYLTYVYGSADLIFSPTEYTKSILISYGLPAEKIVVHTNAVDLAKHFKDEAKAMAGKKKFKLNGGVVVGTVGLVMPRKGVNTFVHLAEKFPRNNFLWFGRLFSLSGALIKNSAKKLPQNIRFTGYVEHIDEAFNSLDIFVFPSVEENEGMAVVEAAAYGLPILVRDIPVYKGWLVHGQNCLKAKNEREFERYLTRLIKDKKLRDCLGRNARKLAAEKSVISIAKKTLLEYKKVLRLA
ncbi:MAG: glycosyltransferase family 4 protein [Patescibacteria group bacterium]|jgi:1,2-diacylglycerol-3-alpha-glucose alpha-1,2-glucosyltransferase